MPGGEDPSRQVDYTQIRLRVRIPRYDNNLHHRREAARFIELGYRVTYDYGRDVHIATHTDGTRRLESGSDLLADYNERLHQAAEAGARANIQARRPERELSDYEAVRKHPKDCGLLNCDHPVHSGGDEYGRLVFEKVQADPKSTKDDLKRKKRDGKDGEGGAGGQAV
ncbi:hypothetical protein LTR78_000839 [Recurvomyces mirabilis]|uniref:Uncharacterized protein n=1 Tax=Recurvomyces mirabilis TaxID=574656 RepID=A0AAE0WWN4_9PEZI|nr:hypothetical protein LTR78_000839 [Recurvomyces mirabilis]KAK5158808.1 hypothetical protein LTS14_002916 [Recurvomyces mirabilis]